jgi:AAA family ATP:ADP antiporter
MDVRNQMRRLFARAFQPFSKVHPDEVGIVALMTLTTFLLLTAYYLLKTVREPLILLQGGAEVKLYARAGQAVLMVGVVHLYGELARRVGRIRLLSIVFLFFISNLAVFAVLAKANVAIGLPFFLWVGVFSYTVIAQFWALAADIYDQDQGRRLFPIVGAGSSVGAVLGGLFAKALVPYGAYVLMGTALVILLACVGLITLIERRSSSRSPRPEEAQAHEPVASESAWRLLAHDRYLWFIAGMVILLNWVNSSGEYLLDRTLVAAAKEAATHGVSSQTFIGSFKADYYFWYNAIGVALQLFAVSRILRVAGVRAALFVMPVFAFGAYGAATFAPILAVMRFVKIGENSLQYSLQDTTRHALFLVTSRAEKFVGKTAIDTVAVRLGAILSSVMVFLGTHRGWPIRTFAIVNAGLAIGWIGFVLLIDREHNRRVAEQARPSEAQAPRPVRGGAAAARISRVSDAEISH